MQRLDAAIQIESSAESKPSDKVLTTTVRIPQVQKTGNISVRVLTTSDAKAGAACLAEAFWTDPACTYFINCPDTELWSSEQKWALHLRSFECIVYAHILSGLALGMSSSSPGQFDAVGLWMPPGKNMDGYFTMLRSGFWRLKWQFSRIGRSRFFEEFFPLLHVTKEQVMRERDSNSWYLVYLGTKASARGKGFGGRIVRHVTEKADVAGIACYLESTNPANLPLYHRLGFELRTSIKLKEKDVSMDIMVREPRLE